MDSSPELLPAPRDKEDRQPDPPNALDCASSPLRVRQSSRSAGGGGGGGGGVGGGGGGGGGGALPRELQCPEGGRCNSAPWTAPVGAGGEVNLGHVSEDKVRVCCDEELETSFTYIDENVNLRLASPSDTSCKATRRPATGSACNGVGDHHHCPEGLPELSLMMSEEDLLSFGESSGTSVDYGFISAVTFLVTGISLVIISYAVPRDVVVDRETVSAREMERLETESARIGAHLDRCVIAGLCLLTLGGVVLSTLLMISMWKGEMYRRKAFAYSKRSTKLYGSINLRPRASPSHSSAQLQLAMEEDVEETLT